MADHAAQRLRMVERQLIGRGIHDRRVLTAMGDVPRHEFVPADAVDEAYDDRALANAAGQTISQPYIVALMAEALRIQLTDRVLDVGTGSGYAAAVMARLASEVYGTERHAELLVDAEERFARLGITNVRTRHTPDVLGWPDEAPFDAICVAAAAPRVPDELVDQLAVGGRLVIPIGPAGGIQRLTLVERTASGTTSTDLGSVAFVPLVT